jgi:hypothetical protein
MTPKKSVISEHHNESCFYVQLITEFFAQNVADGRSIICKPQLMKKSFNLNNSINLNCKSELIVCEHSDATREITLRRHVVRKTSSSAGKLNLEILERKAWPCFCSVSELSKKKIKNKN